MKNGKIFSAHTLNGSITSSSEIVRGLIMKLYQRNDGGIDIPEALQAHIFVIRKLGTQIIS